MNTIFTKGFDKVDGISALQQKYMVAIPDIGSANSTCGKPRPDAFNLFLDPTGSEYPWPGLVLQSTLGCVWYWCFDQVKIEECTHCPGFLMSWYLSPVVSTMLPKKVNDVTSSMSSSMSLSQSLIGSSLLALIRITFVFSVFILRPIFELLLKGQLFSHSSVHGCVTVEPNHLQSLDRPADRIMFTEYHFALLFVSFIIKSIAGVFNLPEVIIFTILNSHSPSKRNSGCIRWSMNNFLAEFTILFVSIWSFGFYIHVESTYVIL